MNWNGILVGAAVFLIIGICHPLVIKMEYRWGKQSWWALALVGSFFAVISLLVEHTTLSTIFGAAAFSFYWSIREIIAQEKRVLRGWFPENPKRSDYYARKREELGLMHKDHIDE